MGETSYRLGTVETLSWYVRKGGGVCRHLEFRRYNLTDLDLHNKFVFVDIFLQTPIRHISDQAAVTLLKCATECGICNLFYSISSF